MAKSEKRNDALLTSGQRRFLKQNGRGLAASTQSEYRAAIRERVKNSLYDFSILLNNWDEDQRQKVMEELEIELMEKKDSSVVIPPSNVLGDAIAFIYLAASDTWQPFEDVLQIGVSKGVKESRGYDMITTVNYSVDIERGIDRNFGTFTLEQLETGDIDSLSEHELRDFVNWYVQTDLFDSDKIRELKAEEHPSPHTGQDEDESVN